MVLGITQEQHPERCQLYAQWQAFDWPILWDPFNTTESKAVPGIVAVDEAGIVRAVGPRTNTFDQDFLAAEFPFSDEIAEAPLERAGLVALETAQEGSFEEAHYAALSDLLWPERKADRSAAVERLILDAAVQPGNPRLAFHAGVALRMRYDEHARGGSDDFQAAIDHWTRALAGDPSQYIWRRRIQQYGPRMDKPYPFYTWVAEARDALRGRGEEPFELVAELTPAELAQPRRSALASSEEPIEPDPESKIPEGTDWVEVEAALAFDTSGDGRTASLHLAFRPNAERAVHWNNEVEPMLVWVGAGDLPAGWALSARSLEGQPPTEETSQETRRFSVDLSLPEGASGELKGYALFYACEDEGGTCVYLRRDFVVGVKAPR